MKLSKVILWVVILGLAAAASYWMEQRAEEIIQQEEQTNKVMAALDDPRKVASITVAGKKFASPVVIERRDQEHRWAITSPIQSTGDGVVIGKVISSLMSATVLRRLDDPKNMADFGLSPADYRITVGFKDGSKSELLVGKVSPTRQYVYTALPGKKQVWFIESGLGQALYTRLFDLRDKAALDFVVSDVTRLELRSPGQGKPLVLQRRKGGAKPDWRFTDGKRADGEAVLDLLYQIHGIMAVGFEDKPGDPAAKGLKPDQGSLVVGMADGKRAGLLVGSLTKDQKHRYTSRLSGGSVMIIADRSIKRLQRAPKALAYRRPWDIDRKAITVMEIKVADRVTIYGKPEGLWVRTQPPGDKKSGEAASLLAWDLANLRWEMILPPDGDYGLENPQAVITLTLGSGQPGGSPAAEDKKRVIRVGKTLKDGKLLAVQVDGDDRIFGVKQELVNGIPGLGGGADPTPGPKS